VDEYQNDITCEPEKSSEPLAFGELIELIDSGDCGGYSLAPEALRDQQLGYCGSFEERCKEAPKYVNFATVTSVFYPQLARWYEKEAANWLQRQLTP
jgi:hypothetical protein